MRSAAKRMMDYCTYCPKMCRFSCPVSEVTKSETDTPWGKMQMGHWILDKKIPLSEEIALPLYQCVNCLRCQEYCEHSNDVPEALREVRNLAVENYAAPPGVFKLGESFARWNNPYNTELIKPKDQKNWQARIRPDAKVVFFPSCHTLKHRPERIDTYFELFNKLNITSVTLIKETIPCCGEPLRSLGFNKEFEEIAEVQYFSMKKFNLVITDNDECCYSLRDHYKKAGYTFKSPALHLLEFLEPFLYNSNYRTQGRFKGRLLFLDPPFLARHLDCGDLPRKIISHVTGFAPIEFSRHGKDTLANGTEGSYNFVFPKLSDKLSLQILNELKGRRIKKIITASSQGEAQLKRLAKGIEVQDIFEFLNEQIL